MARTRSATSQSSGAGAPSASEDEKAVAEAQRLEQLERAVRLVFKDGQIASLQRHRNIRTHFLWLPRECNVIPDMLSKGHFKEALDLKSNGCITAEGRGPGSSGRGP